MRFTYKAQKSSGEFYEGERDAPDRFALARELRGEGETLITAETQEASSHIYLDLKRALPFTGHISIREKIVFIRNLAGMLGAGLTVSRALSVLERQTRTQKFKQIIADLAGRINTGESLSQALSGHPDVFPSLVISMVKAGEEGGNLSLSLFAVSEQLDRSYALQRKVRGALIYPAIVFTVMIVVGIVLFVYVVPQLTGAFKEFNIQLPLTTRIVIAVSDFLQAHFLTGLLLIAGAVIGLLAAVKSEHGRRFVDFAVLHIPAVTPLIKEANAARTASTLSSLLSAGVEVVTALEITANTLPNMYYREVLRKSQDTIQRGEPMSGVFREHEKIFPPFLSEIIAVGEETGKLSPLLKEAGVFFETEVGERAKDISTIIEPALMVIVGVAVGFFAVAMIAPMYSLMDSI